MVIIEGLAGPKGMTKVGPDGHTVNILWLPYVFEEVTEDKIKSPLLDLGC